jgi:hypothetical protein
MLTTIGTIASVGGSLLQGVQASKTAKANAKLVAEQRKTELALNATKEQRTRSQFKTQMRKQMAELAARGVSMDSPTAVLLGQEAAAEMVFQSQTVRQEGFARDASLSAQETAYRQQARSSLLKGVTSAAGGLLTAAPDLWPNLGDTAGGG